MTWILIALFYSSLAFAEPAPVPEQRSSLPEGPKVGASQVSPLSLPPTARQGLKGIIERNREGEIDAQLAEGGRTLELRLHP